MERKPFQVTLSPGSVPENPVKSLWMIWEQSRCDDSVEVMELRYNRLMKGDNQPESDFPVDNKHPNDRFRVMLEMEIPIVEFIHFSFILDNIPVSFREHLVRHRVGTKIGPQSGVDDDPGVTDASFWSQTSRVRDLQNFVDNGFYYTPELDNTELKPISISKGSPDVPSGLTDLEVYHKSLESVQWGYRELRSRGYKPEICRELLPSSTTHRIAWHVNLKSLKHIFSHRSCWIAMANYWHPVIRGVMSELMKIDPVFSALATPPCIDRQTNKFKSCSFAHENAQRLSKKDPGIPCSLWIHQEAGGMDKNYDSMFSVPGDHELFTEMSADFQTFWCRNVTTGNPI